MKEFKKWWNKATINYSSDLEVKQDGRIAKAAWKAALERLYDELSHSEDDKRIKDWVEKELEE